MSQKYTAEWVEEQAAEKGAVWLDHHTCGACHAMVGYQIHGPEVWFASGCDCSWSPPRPSSYDNIASWLAMQSTDDIRDRLMAGFRPAARTDEP